MLLTNKTKNAGHVLYIARELLRKDLQSEDQPSVDLFQTSFRFTTFHDSPNQDLLSRLDPC